jgi:hypothetical protein
MLQLSDKSRRRITLALFAALCVVPTLIVAAWGVSRHLPWHVRGEAQRLGWQLGMKVSLAAVHHPRPGVVRYERLVLANPESGQEVARCRVLEAAWERAGDGRGPGAARLMLAATEPEVEAAALDEVRRLVDRVLTGRAGPLDAGVRLNADSLVLRAGPSLHTLIDLKGSIDTLSEGTLAKLDFRLPGRSTPKPAFVYLGRYRQEAAPVSVLGLDTGPSPLPCSILALAASGLASLGPQSGFRGGIDARETDEGWRATVSGQFEGVELGRLVALRLPSCHLSGKVQVTIEQAVLLDGRLQMVRGTLVGGPGEANAPLLDAAVQRLALVRDADLGTWDRAIRYDLLAAEFMLDGEGLRLRGLCDTQRVPGRGGTILAGRQGPILGEPRLQPLSVAALVRALAADCPAGPSASREVERVLRRMPVPELARFGSVPPGSPAAQASRTRESEPR